MLESSFRLSWIYEVLPGLLEALSCSCQCIFHG